MDSQKYLESYGWKVGEPLQKGGLKKPILVSHKFDLKGIGHQSKDTVTWWETLFDGQLKSLDVNTKGGFGTDSDKLKKIENEERKKKSPLYQMFVKGEVLMGTVDQNGKTVIKTDKKSDNKKRSVDIMNENKYLQEQESLLVFFSSDDESDRNQTKKDERERKRLKKEKKEKKAAKREKKEKKRLKKMKKARQNIQSAD